jgi:hypothetical protein
MGASAQQILQSDPEYLRRQLQAQEMQRVNPTGSAAGALGALLGRGLSNVSQGKGFFQAPDYGLQRVAGVQGIMQSVQFDPSNPAAYYQEVGAALQRAGYSDLAPLAFQEARKLSVQDRELTVREEDIELRREAARKKVSSEQTTTKGIRVFRRGDGPLVVEEGGQDVPYNEKKHGRFETAQDRTAPRGVTIKDITNRVGQVIGREFIDPITGDTIRKSYFEGMGPTAPGAGGGGKDKTERTPLTSFEPGTESTTETSPAGPVRSGRGRPVSNRVPTRPPEFILRGTNRIKNKAYDDWTAQYGATHNPDGTPK